MTLNEMIVDIIATTTIIAGISTALYGGCRGLNYLSYTESVEYAIKNEFDIGKSSKKHHFEDEQAQLAFIIYAENKMQELSKKQEKVDVKLFIEKLAEQVNNPEHRTPAITLKEIHEAQAEISKLLSRAP